MVFLCMEGASWDSSSFSAAEFCRQLIMDMKYPSASSGSGGGGGAEWVFRIKYLPHPL